MTMQTPGQRIRTAREDAGYQQGEFAKLIGIKQITLSEIESGETKLPSAEVALKMTELLGRSLQWIVFGDDGKLETPSDKEEELLTLTRQMDEKSVDALVATAKALARIAGK